MPASMSGERSYVRIPKTYGRRTSVSFVSRQRVAVTDWRTTDTWEIPTGDHISRLSTPHTGRGGTWFDPQSRLVAHADEGWVAEDDTHPYHVIFDWETGKVPSNIDGRVAVSPNRLRAYINQSGSQISIFDLTTNKVISVGPGHTHGPARLAFGPTTDQIYSWAYREGVVRAWDGRTGREVATFPAPQAGMPVITGSPPRLTGPIGDNFVIMDPTTGKHLASYQTLLGKMIPLGHERIATTLSSRPVILDISHKDTPRIVWIGPIDPRVDHELFAFGDSPALTSGDHIVVFDPDLGSIRFHIKTCPYSQAIATAQGGVRGVIADKASFQIFDRKGTLSAPRRMPVHATTHPEVAMSADGSYVAFSANSEVALWRVGTATVHVVDVHRPVSAGIALSAEGDKLAVGLNGGPILVWSREGFLAAATPEPLPAPESSACGPSTPLNLRDAPFPVKVGDPLPSRATIEK